MISYAGQWISPSLHFHPDSGFNMFESTAVFTPTWGIQNLKLTYFELDWSLLGTKNSKCSTPKTQRLLKNPMAGWCWNRKNLYKSAISWCSILVFDFFGWDNSQQIFQQRGGASVEAIAQQLDAQHQCTQAQQAQKGLGCRNLWCGNIEKYMLASY